MTLADKIEYFIESAQKSLRYRAYRAISLPERIVDIKYSIDYLIDNDHKPDANLQWLLEDLFNSLNDEIREISKLKILCEQIITDCGWTIENVDEESIIYKVNGPCYNSED